MSESIQRHSITTKNGNILQIFYNPNNELVVVDLIHTNERGGTELLRRTLNEEAMLKHALTYQGEEAS